MTPLSPHFSLEELTRSATAGRLGIDNTPPPDCVQRLRALCEDVLERIRSLLDQPVRVNSGYRCPELNAAVGGSTHSQHLLGEAVDIEVPGLSNKRLAELIRGSVIPFDQLILEHTSESDPSAGWVHVSHKSKGNRKQFVVIPRSRPQKE